MLPWLAGCGCGCGWPICLFDLLGYGLVDAVVILNDAMLASICLSDRVEDPSSARCVVHSAWLCAPVLARMSALKAAFCVTMRVPAALVDPQVPDRCGIIGRLVVSVASGSRNLIRVPGRAYVDHGAA